MKCEEDELAFVIERYRVPVPAAACRLLLERARLAQERRLRRVDDRSAALRPPCPPQDPPSGQRPDRR